MLPNPRVSRSGGFQTNTRMTRTAPSPGPPNVFRLLVCFAFMMASSGCNVIIKKRRYFKGYYVHFPLGSSSTPLKPRREFFPPADSIPELQKDTSGFYAVTEDRIPPRDTLPQPANVPVVLLPDSIAPASVVRLTLGNPVPGRDTSVSPFFVFTFTQAPPPVQNTPGVPVTPGQNSSSQTPFSFSSPVLQTLPFPAADTIRPIAFTHDTLRRDTLDYFATMPALHADSAEYLPLLDTIAYVPPDTPKPRKRREFPEVQPEFYTQLGASGFQMRTTYPVQPNSFSAGAGFRFSTPLRGRTAAVGEFGYRVNHFYLSRSRPKAAPLSNVSHDKERITMNMLSGGLAVRYNFKEKEDRPEQLIELGAYGDWSFRTANVYVDKHEDPHSPIGTHFHSKHRITGLPYLNKLNCGVTARYDRNFFGVFAMYRLSDLIRRGVAEPDADLPRVVVGVEISLR